MFSSEDDLANNIIAENFCDPLSLDPGVASIVSWTDLWKWAQSPADSATRFAVSSILKGMAAPDAPLPLRQSADAAIPLCAKRIMPIQLTGGIPGKLEVKIPNIVSRVCTSKVPTTGVQCLQTLFAQTWLIENVQLRVGHLE